MSIGFVARESQWFYSEDGSEDVRRLIDLDLIEVSPVAFPAYPGTVIQQKG